jgi:Fe-S-cluster-containing dehydrogenase component
MTTYGIVIEVDKCIGCSICLKACKDEFIGNDYPGYSTAQPSPDWVISPSAWPDQGQPISLSVVHGQNWMEFSEDTQGTFPNVNSKFVYMACMQCANPPCLAAAATGNAVTQRADGIILFDPVNSQYQKPIVDSCPYGRAYWNSNLAIPQKCTFCAHLVDQGKNPKCVDSCPVQAITFGDTSDPNSAISKLISSLNPQPLHPEYGTEPRVLYSGLP